MRIACSSSLSSHCSRQTDISTIDALSLRDLDAPLWLLSPSCQPYTVLNPAAKGAADPRAKSFLHLVERVLPDLAMQNAAPKWLLIENVAGFEASIISFTSKYDIHLRVPRPPLLGRLSLINCLNSTIILKNSC